jgi:HEAT repeat protein
VDDAAPGAEKEIEKRGEWLRSLRLPGDGLSNAELEQRLLSNNQNTVAEAASALRGRKSATSIPALTPMLRDSRPWQRYIALITLADLGAEHEAALLLQNDPDANGRRMALYYLALDCAIDLPRLESRLGVSFDDVVMYGIAFCGDSGSFAKVRPFLASANQPVRDRAKFVLTSLTFQGELEPTPRTPAGWDAWYERHRTSSRSEWAVRCLTEGMDWQRQPGAVNYLGRLKDRQWLPQFHAAAASRHYEVRIAAAEAISQFDPQAARALLRRELGNRQIRACLLAAGALNRVTRQVLEFDFRLPSERQRAVGAYG